MKNKFTNSTEMHRLYIECHKQMTVEDRSKFDAIIAKQLKEHTKCVCCGHDQFEPYAGLSNSKVCTRCLKMFHPETESKSRDKQMKLMGWI